MFKLVRLGYLLPRIINFDELVELQSGIILDLTYSELIEFCI